MTYNQTHACKLGYQGATNAENVTFLNLEIAGQRILDAQSGRFDINEYTSNIVFAST